MSRKYSREEAEEILRRALEGEANKPADDAIGHSDLRAAAEEVGISEEALEQAAAQISIEQKKLALHDKVLLKRQRDFRGTALTFAVVGAAVVGLGLLRGTGIPVPWVGVAALVWLVLRAKRAYLPAEDDLERAALKEGERETRRTRRTRAREKREANEHERRLQKTRTKEQFERVVTNGVDALLSAAADKLEEMSEQDRKSRPPRRAPQVRVDPSPTVPEPGITDARSDARRKSGKGRI